MSHSRHPQKWSFLVLGLVLVLAASDAAHGETEASSNLPEGPDFEDVLSLPSTGGPRISPDGSVIAYTVRSTDWDDNRYDTEIWLAPRGEEPFQLTRTRDKSSTGPEWSPDGRWLAFLADRGDERQVFVIRAAGGEALQLTAVEDGVGDFEWSHDGRFMALSLTEPASESAEKREELYGEFAVEDAEHRMTHLWLLDVGKAKESDGGAELPPEEEDEAEEEGEAEEDSGDESALRRLTEGDDFTVSDFVFSPDDRSIAFSHRPEPTVGGFAHSDLSVLEVSTGEARALVERPGYDGDPVYSPDGKWILFGTANETFEYYKNGELAKIPAAGGDVTLLTAGFDENPNAVAWLSDGIRFTAFQKTHRPLFHLDPASGEIRRLTEAPRFIWSVDYSADGRQMALLARDGSGLTEIYRTASEPFAPQAVTAMTREIAEWPLGTREVIEWESRDGAKIEGILFKPEDFDASKRHPLLVIIHGGPAGISTPTAVASYVYPVQQWLAKGAVILMPNYRGSAGYGEDFRALNVRNLGVGDAWDVLSGVDALIERGVADPERLGAMGWSQGGYISAFLTTTSDRFKAISVGAGISNWMTYYVNTDIHPFTRHYLEGTPWSDPEIYAKTSPMTYINDAETPTLIQHGEFDRRVPTPNAYELFQGLQDVGVETRLIVYKGFGHGITKPKERLGAVWHNWQWFAKYVWGEEVEIPLEGETDAED